MKAIYTCVLGLVMTASMAVAGDFESKYRDAFNDFENRGKSVQYAERCVSKAGTALQSARSDEEKYDALVLQSRCKYFVGMRTSGDSNKIKIFKEAMKYADSAKKVLKDRAEAYYFYGINLGRWAEANGINKSLRERHNLRRSMEAVRAKAAKNDEGKAIAGKEYDGWGANRTLGRMYFKLPGMFGGDNGKAENFLREAYANMSKEYPNGLNVVYLAEVLVARDKKAEARQILDHFLKFDGKAEKYNPKRIPEVEEELALARALRKELGN